MADKQNGNPAGPRGDIARGKAAGKRSGFDPAAAPIETDAEAGGAPPGADEVRTSRATQARPDRPDLDVPYESAMQLPQNVEEGGDRSVWAASTIMLAAAAFVFIVAAIASMLA